MTDNNIGDRLRAALSVPPGEVDQDSLLRIIDDLLQPLETLTVTEVATLAGANYRERQNVKRKAARWTKGFEALSPLERLTMLRAMAASGPRGLR